MIHLLDFLVESLAIVESGAMTAEMVIKKLSSNHDLDDYVDVLNGILGDADGKAILTKVFTDSDNDDAIEFDGAIVTIPVKNLHPTQSEIDVDKSIGYPFKDVKKAEVNMKNFFQHADGVKMPFPLITFNGMFILDGHHRWSQVYTFNPEASMECFDLKVKSGDKISAQDALKICQGILAAKRAEDGKGKIPKSVVEGANLFKMSDNDVKAKVLEYCDKNPEPAKIIMEACGKDSNDNLASYLTANLMLLKKDNAKYANDGNGRGVMPQTDKGGDNPNSDGIDQSAKPDAKGSALNKMVNSKIDPDVLPQK